MKKIIIVNLLFLTINSVFALEKVRNYNEQIAFIFNLSGKFTVNEIGIVNYSGYEYKMYKITYGAVKTNNTRKYLFISGVHGNEIAPIYAMKEFIQRLDLIMLIDNITIDFIYILNPYGFEYGLRYNGNGIDLNRDFINFRTNETKFLVNSIGDKKYTGVYDFHEHGSTTGFMLYYYSYNNRVKANNILKMLQKNNIPLENKFVDVILETKNGAIYVPFYAKIYFMNIIKQATTGLYFNKMKVDEVFVFETPRNMNLEKRKTIINMLLEHITGIQAKPKVI
jgi:hypothetical protein